LVGENLSYDVTIMFYEGKSICLVKKGVGKITVLAEGSPERVYTIYVDSAELVRRFREAIGES